ncbi:RNA-binding protein, putative [Plasmodium berghei]|uniref:RNA-binding protein, putative n=2 Tax=Plasmodium berghei TaxID=5821 RepID=A0A509AH21_PLABA|nr:RNA-binding protein, putative [Plasmodium berghei ANKA]CXI29827.1 RNA-binding protein, putative [Plasmodium berghei]SCM20778.1 RNA-binding protein, putative [Plasmodium berghei]SCN24315.1 RNA-binding protein, putative [Plasmodium berghei]SCO59489.1 RNA-binding protein, putative [Plasmodium berghei]SCO60726.1 RNA-binding protein, putative [Plasmodium berghei]|eukprot:XP_034421028.1 RNA-binding protein, putative [Plasmodium berghei ANKA]
MGIFDKIKSIEKLNETELKNLGTNNASWHDQYKESSYIYIGNLDTRLTEGDIVIVFSQFGEPIDVNLVRDKETGKSKGYCFLAYEDQRSTILAVDNFNGFKLLDKPLVVDHILNYRLPQKYMNNDEMDQYKPTGAEGQGIGIYNVVESEIKLSKAFEKLNNNHNKYNQKKLMDEDELWSMNFEKLIKGDSDKKKGDGNDSYSSDGNQIRKSEHKKVKKSSKMHRSKKEYGTKGYPEKGRERKWDKERSRERNRDIYRKRDTVRDRKRGIE